MITLNYRAHEIVAPKETDPQPQEATSQPFPNLTICQAVHFDDPQSLSSLSCLQTTVTGLFFTWLLPVMPESPRLQASPGVLEQSYAEFHSATEVDELSSFGLLDGKILVPLSYSGGLVSQDPITGSVADGDESMYEGDDNDQASRATDESNDAVQLAESSTQPHWGEVMNDNGYYPGRSPFFTPICCHSSLLSIRVTNV